MIYAHNELYEHDSEDYQKFKLSIERGAEFNHIKSQFLDNEIKLYQYIFFIMEDSYAQWPSQQYKEALAKEFINFFLDDFNDISDDFNEISDKKIILMLGFYRKADDYLDFRDSESYKIESSIEYIIKEYQGKYKNNISHIDYSNYRYPNLDKESILLPADERWRLYVDGDKQCSKSEQGWIGYEERESGCINAMHGALNNALNDIEMPLNWDLIVKYHANALAENIKDGFAVPNNTHYGIQSLSSQGTYNALIGGVEPYNEIGTKIKFSNQDFFLKVVGNSTLDFCKQTINKYEERMNLNLSNAEKFHEIVKLTSYLAKAHPFKDANCRTFSIILLNKELMRHDFYPSIMNNPNALDGFTTVEDGVKLVIKGIENYKCLLTNGQFPNCPEELQTENLIKNNSNQSPPKLDDFDIVKEKSRFKMSR